MKSADGIVNLAPFSISNQLAYDPPFVFFSGCGVVDDVFRESRPKDSVTKAENTGEFVWSMATYNLRDQVSVSSPSVTPDVNEMDLAGLHAGDCHLVSVPRIAESPVSLECKYHTTLTLPSNAPGLIHRVVIGLVVGIHIADWALTDGRVDYKRIRPLARLGYMDYTFVDHVFEMPVPGGDPRGMIGEPS